MTGIPVVFPDKTNGVSMDQPNKLEAWQVTGDMWVSRSLSPPMVMDDKASVYEPFL